MSRSRQTRSTRSQATELNNSLTESSSQGKIKSPIGASLKNKPSQGKKMVPSPRHGRKTMALAPTSLDEEQDSDTDLTDNDEDDVSSNQLTQTDAFAPSREFSIDQTAIRQRRRSSNVSWAGLKNGADFLADDQGSISDLDMHGSVSSDSDMEEKVDDEEDDTSSIAGSDNAAIEEEIEIPDDDDDYAGVDNVSDTSDHSDQFEREVEAAWQHDDIDWNDEYVYQYDESPHRGFLFDEAFLNVDLDQVWSNWQIQFLDFDHRGSSRPGVITDAPMHDSPLVRRVNEMNMNARTQGSTSSSSDSSSQSRGQSPELVDKETQIEDDDGDETEDDLPEESQYPSPISQQAVHVCRSSDASKNNTSSPAAPKRPVLCRMPVDTTRITAFSLPTADGKFVRRVTLPLAGNTEWVTIPGRRFMRNQDGSPTSSIATEMSYQDDMLYHAINGRLFQQAHFNARLGPSLAVLPAPLPTHNSFLSGPALHESSLFDNDDEFMGFDDEISSEPADIAQLVDFDALTRHRDYYPPSGRIRAQSAELPSTLHLEPSLVSLTSTSITVNTADKALENGSIPIEMEPSIANGQVQSKIKEGSQPSHLAPAFSPTKRRASPVSETTTMNTRTKRKRI